MRVREGTFLCHVARRALPRALFAAGDLTAHAPDREGRGHAATYERTEPLLAYEIASLINGPAPHQDSACAGVYYGLPLDHWLPLSHFAAREDKWFLFRLYSSSKPACLSNNRTDSR